MGESGKVGSTQHCDTRCNLANRMSGIAAQQQARATAQHPAVTRDRYESVRMLILVDNLAALNQGAEGGNCSGTDSDRTTAPFLKQR